MTNIDTMLLPDLKKVASSLGLKGAGAMRKAELVQAIRSAQGDAGDRAAVPKTRSAAPAAEPRSEPPAAAVANGAPAQARSAPEPSASEPSDAASGQRRQGRDQARQGGDNQRGDNQRQGAENSRGENSRGRRARREQGAPASEVADVVGARLSAELGQASGGDDVGARLDALAQGTRRERSAAAGDSGASAPAAPAQEVLPTASGRDSEEEFGGSRRNRRRRNRDRNNRQSGRGNTGLDKMESEPTVTEDDVLVNVSGILDVLDSYAFVRTEGYLPSPNDAYVSLSMVRKYGLRKGDIVTGAMRAHREGERQKFSPLVRLDTVNAEDPANARNRPEFNKLTPLYPQERLRLETTPTNMAGRIVDLVAPIGKGQRGLIVSPPKAGKTMVMQSIANSIIANNPEVHLMVVLVDERPEEVTDFQRSVRGEVIASTFDRPASDHTTVAELAIERAKRLVERGLDVVILLDGITRLSRAYNLAAPASGRILSGGVDSAALYPPKKFFGAARNVEDGGSLTILATALVETGSKMDEVIFEEFKGTGNMELRLRREMADKRIFPAIDAVASGTRREEQLLTREELAIMWKLRRVLSGLDDQAALEMLINRLRKTQTNLEFLHVISRTTPGGQE